MSNKFNIENNEKLRQNAFKVPEGYLEGLEDKLKDIAKDEPKVMPLKPKRSFKSWYAIAAAFTILLASTWLLNQDRANTIPELNATEIAELSEEGLVTYSDLELLEYVSVDELEDFWPETEEDDINMYFESTDLQYMNDYYLYEDI